jgi:hypothetical protein
VRRDLQTERVVPNAGEDWPVYSLYGFRLASDFPFANRLAKTTGEPDLTFQLVDAAPMIGLEDDTPVYASSPELDGVEESVLKVYRQGSCHILRITGVVDYYIAPDSILCYLVDPDYEYLAEIHFLGIAFSLWLELRGMPALHASAVVVEDRVVAFLSTNKGGKSSLAATLMQAGYPLVTDDILPLEQYGEKFLGRPGYPQMRMWPDQARYFLGHYEDLGIVHPAYSKRRVPVGTDGLGTFRRESAPLACFYLPERRDPAAWGAGIEITSPPRMEALMSLVGQSFVPHTVEALGLQPHRLGFFARLLSRVPVRRIVYPEGYTHLPQVRRSILRDLARIQ